MGWILLVVYIIGIFICALIFPKIFPFKDGDWEYDNGEFFPIDKDLHRINIETMVALWPIFFAFILFLLPMKLITEIVDRYEN